MKRKWTTTPHVPSDLKTILNEKEETKRLLQFLKDTKLSQLSRCEVTGFATTDTCHKYRNMLADTM